MNSMPRLREFLDAFLAPWQVAAGILFGTALILVLRGYGVADLTSLPNWIFGVGWLLLVYSGVVLAIRIGQSSGRCLQGVRAKQQRRRRINQDLDTLSQEEREVIKYLLSNNQRSITGRIIAGHFAPLVQKGLLIRAVGTYSILDWPHTVPDDVWEELKRRRGEFVGNR